MIGGELVSGVSTVTAATALEVSARHVTVWLAVSWLAGRITHWQHVNSRRLNRQIDTHSTDESIDRLLLLLTG